VVASLLLNSDMIVALPEDAVQPYLAAGLMTALPFDLGVSMDSFGIVTRKRHQLSPGADAMLQALRGCGCQHVSALPQAGLSTIYTALRLIYDLDMPRTQ
jgi:DNA-binding transcriptional LysR family regulator